jgi:hypothetical protein
MPRNRKIAAAVAAAGALALGGAGAAVADSSAADSSDTPITGSALDSASQAALEVTGGGEVPETEVGDEEGAYEVEVTLPDGSQTAVHLDKQFNHIGSEAETGSEANDSN